MLSPKARSLALATPLGLWLAGSFAAPIAVVVLLGLQASHDGLRPLSTVGFSAAQASALSSTLVVLGDTLTLSAMVTLACALLGYPLALWLNRLPSRAKPVGFAIVLVPLLTTIVVHALGMMGVMTPTGLASGLLDHLTIDRSDVLFTWGVIGLALTQVFLPYMTLALYEARRAIDPRLYDTARTLGIGPGQRFLNVTLPLSLPGLKAGAAIVFLLAAPSYVSATLLGRQQIWTTGMLVYREALVALNQPVAASLMLLLLIASGALVGLALQAIGRPPSMGRKFVVPLFRLPPPFSWLIRLAIGYFGWLIALALWLAAVALLLAPPVAVVEAALDFDLRAALATHSLPAWQGFSLVGTMAPYRDALLLSGEVAAMSAALAIALTLPAALALTRGELPGRRVWTAWFLLPLALPGVALAIGLLRLVEDMVPVPPLASLVALHTVLVAPFSLILLRRCLRRLGSDLEDIAGTLGAGPFARFRLVVWPLMKRDIAAAFLVSALISFGEVTATALLAPAHLETLPVRLYAETAAGTPPNAAGAVMIGLALAGFVLIAWLMRDRRRGD